MEGLGRRFDFSVVSLKEHSRYFAERTAILAFTLDSHSLFGI